MVLGINEGKIEITLDRQAYNRGDAINCTCILRLNQSTESRQLKALFQRIEGSGKHTNYIFLGAKELGPARVYRDGERFEFSFPVDEKAAPEITKFGGLTGIMHGLLMSKPVRWSIEVALDMPMKIDISGFVNPSINRPVVQK